MEKRSTGKNPIHKARHFLHCVILEQKAATEELRASNSELERLLEDVVSSRHDLAGIVSDEPEEAAAPVAAPEPVDRSATQLRREADAILEQASAAIRQSVRLR